MDIRFTIDLLLLSSMAVNAYLCAILYAVLAGFVITRFSKTRLVSGFYLATSLSYALLAFACCTMLLGRSSYALQSNLEFVSWSFIISIGTGIATAIHAKKILFAAISLLLVPNLPTIGVLLPDHVWHLTVIANSTVFLLGIALAAEAVLNARNHLGPHNVKDAFDVIPYAALFVTDSGKLIFINQIMESVLRQLDITRIRHHKDAVWKQLVSIAQAQESPLISYQAVSLATADGRQWLFQLSEFQWKQKTVLQILGSDTTEQMLIAEQIVEDTRKLEIAHQRALLYMQQIEELELNQLRLDLHTLLHDTLGQNVSFVHRFLEDDVTDRQRLLQLQSLLKNLNENMFEEISISPEEFINRFCQACNICGLQVSIRGDIPAETTIAQVFLKAIREATTNAVLHGDSKEVTISFYQDKTSYQMSITNSGYLEPGKIVEGNGITGIRRRLAEVNGSLEIATKPSFTLTATVPLAQTAST